MCVCVCARMFVCLCVFVRVYAGMEPASRQKGQRRPSAETPTRRAVRVDRVWGSLRGPVCREAHTRRAGVHSPRPREPEGSSLAVSPPPADAVPCVCSQHPGPAGPAPEDLPVARQPRALARLVRQPRGGGRAARGPRAELALPRRVLAGRGQAGRPCGAGARLPAPGPRLLEGRWHRVPVQHRWATGRPRQLALLLPAVASLKSAKPRCPVSVKQWPVFKDASVRWRPHGDSLPFRFFTTFDCNYYNVTERTVARGLWRSGSPAKDS